MAENHNYTATMSVVCCVCRREYARRPCVPEAAKHITHGYCHECGERERRKLNLLPRRPLTPVQVERKPCPDCGGDGTKTERVGRGASIVPCGCKNAH
jgi:hypothetical protein